MKKILLIVLVLIVGYAGEPAKELAKEPEPINLKTLEERDGVWYAPYTGAVFLLNSSGEKEMGAYLKDGKVDGKVTGYYRNGQIEHEQNYKDGEKDGKATWYNEDGSIDHSYHPPAPGE